MGGICKDVVSAKIPRLIRKSVIKMQVMEAFGNARVFQVRILKVLSTLLVYMKEYFMIKTLKEEI